MDEYDAFVEQWYNLGGTDITNEANEWYQSSGKHTAYTARGRCRQPRYIISAPNINA